MPLLGEPELRGRAASWRWTAGWPPSRRTSATPPLAKKIIGDKPADVDRPAARTAPASRSRPARTCPASRARLRDAGARSPASAIATDIEQVPAQAAEPRRLLPVEFTDDAVGAARRRSSRAASATGASPASTSRTRSRGRPTRTADGSVIYGGRPLGPAPRSVPFGCLSRRSPIGPRNIGRVRLGLTRKQLRRRARRRQDHAALAGAGACAAAAARSSPSSRPRGGWSLVATTARRHGNRLLRPGSRLGLLQSAYPTRRPLGKGLFRAGAAQPAPDRRRAAARCASSRSRASA